MTKVADRLIRYHKWHYDHYSVELPSYPEIMAALDWAIKTLKAHQVEERK